MARPLTTKILKRAFKQDLFLLIIGKPPKIRISPPEPSHQMACNQTTSSLDKAIG